MFTRAIVLATAWAALPSGCASGPDPAEETQEVIDNLIEAGFRADDILVADGAVYVGRDALVTLEASREMLEPGDGTAEHYRTTNLVSTSLRKICINPTSAFNAYSRLSQGLDLAIGNYNALPLVFDFARGPATGCNANIAARTVSGVGGSAGFPSGGLPFPYINIGTGLQSYNVDANEHLITHELGHTLGLRHSDFFRQAHSCGVSEPSASVGAIHIPGTPTTSPFGGSIFNACIPSGTTGELTSTDVTALTYLY